MAKKKLKTVGDYIDAHYKLKMERDRIINTLNAKKKEIEKLAEEALALFKKEDLEGARGSSALGYVEERDVYKLEDRRKLDAYVKRTGNFQLFQNRVTPDAVKELEALGKKVPGIRRITLTNFRTRKI